VAGTSSRRRGPFAEELSLHVREDVRLEREPFRIAAVADTHSRPHPELGTRLEELAPDRILHAGDVGAPEVIRALEHHAPVTAVRGNIDARGLPDAITISLCRSGETVLRILLTHIAVSGVKLRADVLRLARAEEATLVVCGHSHVPLVAEDRAVTVFNPGSAGPRRFSLPIVLGVIDISAAAISMRHVECESGLRWTP
jgi:putative phosphoesterase